MVVAVAAADEDDDKERTLGSKMRWVTGLLGIVRNVVIRFVCIVPVVVVVVSGQGCLVFDNQELERFFESEPLMMDCR